MAYLEQLSGAKSPLERIGYGYCGTVWANPQLDEGLPGSGAVVLKQGDGISGRSIINEHQIHQGIQSAAAQHSHESASTAPNSFHVNIPFNSAFMGPHDDAWARILPNLPAGSKRHHALVSERIMPLPREARRLLAQRFWSDNKEIVAAADDKSNKHCLLRPYLGRRRQLEGQMTSFTYISFRNFPLHLDQIEELGLPAEQYALAMADTLAFLHWEVRIDAAKVEFVLARPRTMTNADSERRVPQPGIGVQGFTTGVLGALAMWLLDFDCCKPLTMDEEGVRIAAGRFWKNDPFYPNPGYKCAKDEKLWRIFRDRFLEVSDKILTGESENIRRLPGMLVARIAETVGLYKGRITH